MKRALVCLLVMFSLPVIASPAEAKVPSRPPERTVQCANGRLAKIWWQGTWHLDDTYDPPQEYLNLTEFAVRNNCDQWLMIRTVGEPESASDCCLYVQIAPGANFTKTDKDSPSANFYAGGYGGFSARLLQSKECSHSEDGGQRGSDYDVAKDGVVTPTRECGAKYPPSQWGYAECYSYGDQPRQWARAIWKVDGKNLIKLEVTNPCTAPSETAIVWWRYKGGTVAVWVDPSTETDLWKSELKSLPTKTKDAELHFSNDPALAHKDLYTQNWKASGDTLTRM